jgi:outer membrane protein assembly factor BamA
MCSRAALSTAIYCLLFAGLCCAQVLQVPRRCSPPSSLVRLSTRSPIVQTAHGLDEGATKRKVIIERIEFDGPVHLPDSVVAQIITDTNELGFWSDSNWLDQLTEARLRSAWQDMGYFRVNVTAKASSLGGDSQAERFIVTAHVDEGLQYHFGDLRFADVRLPGTVFSETKLHADFPLQEGDLFRVNLIRKGIEELDNLYLSHGYINFTSVPETMIDDRLQRISLTINLDQGKQYQVGSVEVLGIDQSLASGLRAIIRPGEIFNIKAAWDFLRENRSLLSAYASSDDLSTRPRGMTDSVDVLFDGRPCPPLN